MEENRSFQNVTHEGKRLGIDDDISTILEIEIPTLKETSLKKKSCLHLPKLEIQEGEANVFKRAPVQIFGGLSEFENTLEKHEEKIK